MLMKTGRRYIETEGPAQEFFSFFGSRNGTPGENWYGVVLMLIREEYLAGEVPIESKLLKDPGFYDLARHLYEQGRGPPLQDYPPVREPPTNQRQPPVARPLPPPQQPPVQRYPEVPPKQPAAARPTPLFAPRPPAGPPTDPRLRQGTGAHYIPLALNNYEQLGCPLPPLPPPKNARDGFGYGIRHIGALVNPVLRWITLPARLLDLMSTSWSWEGPGALNDRDLRYMLSSSTGPIRHIDWAMVRHPKHSDAVVLVKDPTAPLNGSEEFYDLDKLMNELTRQGHLESPESPPPSNPPSPSGPNRRDKFDRTRDLSPAFSDEDDLNPLYTDDDLLEESRGTPLEPAATAKTPLPSEQVAHLLDIIDNHGKKVEKDPDAAAARPMEEEPGSLEGKKNEENDVEKMDDGEKKEE